MALMMAPDNLVLLGNLAGKTGLLLPLLLLLVGGLYILNAQAYALAYRVNPNKSGELHLFQSVYGDVAALCLSLFVRLSFACLAATSFLVASGFVFNEVFIYWFPNFAAAFILLGGVLLINLIGPNFSRRMQVVFLLAACGAIGILIVAGLIGSQNATPYGVLSQPTVSIDAILPAALLFLGIDLLYLNSADSSVHPGFLLRYMTISIIGAGFLFACWGLLSPIFVMPERLADTSIPHIITARSILGQGGRILMGIVVMAGSCAAVNALLHAIDRIVQSAASLQLIPQLFSRKRLQKTLPLFFSAVVIAAMMALGVAGSENLDLYLRAAAVMWLMLYAAFHAALVIDHQGRHPQQSWIQTLLGYKRHVLAVVTLTASAIGLIVWGSQPGIMLKFVGATLLFSAIAGWGLIQWAHRTDRHLR